jgi:hypothetical protein
VVYLTLAAVLVGGYLLRRRAARDILPSAGEPELTPGEQQPSK